ncbi:peptidylprolyl isomerase [Caulobacter mirabilis]|uniref:peptidylprolyl isomerase n=1 Tax=Caulobacter mirabilis TaxID=69666 RepID=A0A2D2AZT1_9CAUL|nr:peptidylprolyl isomerase [Caulobacter mirabilis]ATQ43437.1 peptidylprolyl isomerase [Caulobacter mirabilis]
MKSALSAIVLLSLAAPAAAQTPSDWRTPDPENILVVETNKGRIIVEMEPNVAPAHVERYRTLARKGFYDGLEFFRVIEGFMDQTGDPQNNGTGGSDLPDLEAEFPFRRGASVPFVEAAKLPADNAVPQATEVGFVGVVPVRSAPSMQMMISVDGKAPAWGLFCQGVMGAARSNNPNSANSQFFFMRGPYASLDGQYTAWGRVISGQDVVVAIKTGEPVAPPRDVMKSVKVLADIPAAQRPKIQVMDTRGPAFKALIDKARGADGRVDPCAIEIPAKIG